MKRSATLFFAVAAVLLGAGNVDASTLVVANKGEDTVSLIHFESGEERARLRTGPQPHEVALSPTGEYAAVVAYGGQTIDIIDIAEARSVAVLTLPQGARPHGLAWLDDGRIVATAEGLGALIIIPADRGGVVVIPLNRLRPHMTVVSPDGRLAYVSNVNSGVVSVVDLNHQTVLAELEAGQAPEGIALSPDARTLWVAERDADRVRVFDTHSLAELGAVKTGERPIRIMLSSDGRHAITSNFVDGTLTVIDTETLLVRQTITIADGVDANMVTILPGSSSGQVLVAETGHDRVAEVDLASAGVVRRIAVGRRGDGLALSPVDVAPH
ncbi:hypothetical protein IWC96_05440 [Brevundimonas sp. BAL450]|uniref:cytochrome D1 domain-containing protein n=1 Tax=Brevundimonas sp. BAL450 TaxID=1708162 RepID=UPI0018CB4364|nr:cytochrome D1 domain-containing protein [Brevundimonas sp. BAL450]MBG7614725.1 hypothetical protein [Brevundimonas sp. BAL450]